MIARSFFYHPRHVLTVAVLLALAFSKGHAAKTTPVIIDLAQDLEESGSVNLSPGAQTVNEFALNDTYIRAALVMEKGKIVSSYVRSDVDPLEPFQCWSTTKSWISLLFGMMVQDGILSVDETLGEIFPDDTAWLNITNVTDVNFRKAVTIHEMLTMSSGLISPPVNMSDPAAAEVDLELMGDGGTDGGANLATSLSYPFVGPKGEFSYLGISSIMSYILQAKTGKSPREYLVEKVLPSLGIEDSEINWWRNADGIEYPYHGIELTAHQMAKFGQLYLQGGKSSAENQLIASDWVNTSMDQLVSFNQEVIPNVTMSSSYGYLFWVTKDNGDLFLYQGTNLGEVACAIGAGGQDICIDPVLQRISVQQRDFDESGGWNGMLAVGNIAMDPTLSFEAEGDGSTATNGDHGDDHDGSTATNGDRGGDPDEASDMDDTTSAASAMGFFLDSAAGKFLITAMLVGTGLMQ